ncbi:MAG: hypothetical protein ACH350_07755 [Parachlamydiaceae bacterium]
MSNLFLTLVIAFVIIVFAIALMAVGWLITGKTRLEKGCGKDPTKKRDDSCHACDLCSTSSGSNPQSEKEENSSSFHTRS